MVYDYTGSPEPHRVRGVVVPRGIPVKPKQGPGIPEPITDDREQLEYQNWKARLGGTYLEFLVWRWLVESLKYTPDEDFFFQSSQLGGRSIVGGAVVDFELPNDGLVFRVQGEFFHVGNPSIEAYDYMQALVITSARNYTVVDLQERDLLDRLEYTMKFAMQGIQLHEVR